MYRIYMLMLLATKLGTKQLLANPSSRLLLAITHIVPARYQQFAIFNDCKSAYQIRTKSLRLRTYPVMNPTAGLNQQTPMKLNDWKNCS